MNTCKHKEYVSSCLSCTKLIVKTQAKALNNLSERWENLYEVADASTKELMFNIDKKFYLTKP